MGQENHISFKALLARLKSETPKFWKAVRLHAAAYSVALTTFGGILVANPNLPMWMQSIGMDLIKFVPVAGGLVMLLSSLTTNPENPPSDKL